MLQLRPTFSESWYRVVNLRARLRPSAQISRQYYRGERWYVVRDPAGNQYHRLSDAAYRFVGLLDGSRTVGEAWDLVGGQLDDEAPTQPEVIQILSQLHSANLLESDMTADSNVLLRRHKMQMKRKFQGRLMNILFPRIPLWDPDRTLKRWMPVARVVMSPIGAIAWLIVVIAATVLMIPRWGEFMIDYQDALNIGSNPEKAFYLFAMFWILKFFHEMGHAFAARRFGGEVHEMGIMFLVFIPTPYVDASSAWAFPSRWHRMFVGAGGMVVELFLAGIAAFVYIATKPGVPVLGLPMRELMTDAIMIAGFTTVIFNANPLLRYDGYYMLSDWLEIPNLQQKSKDYLLGLIKRHVFRIKSQQPLPPVGQRLWLFFYGIASTIYRVFVGIMIILLVAWQVPVLGVLMALGGLVTWLVVPVVKTFKYLALEPELHRKRGRATAFTLCVVTAAFVLIGLIKFPVHVDAAGVIEPQNKVVLNVEQGGFVRKVHVFDGQQVQPGDVLIELEDKNLATTIAETEANLDAADLQRRALINTGKIGQANVAAADVETFTTQLKDLRARYAELTVRAPIAGQVVGPELKFLTNSYVDRGKELCRVETNDKLVVRSIIPQAEVALASRVRQKSGDYSLSKDPEIRLVSDQQTTLKGDRRVKLIPGAQKVLPSQSLTVAGGGEITPDRRDPEGKHAEIGQFEMKVDLANADNKITSGQRAWVRLTVGKETLAWLWYNKFLQLIETKNKTSTWTQF